MCGCWVSAGCEASVEREGAKHVVRDVSTDYSTYDASSRCQQQQGGRLSSTEHREREREREGGGDILGWPSLELLVKARERKRREEKNTIAFSETELEARTEALTSCTQER